VSRFLPAVGMTKRGWAGMIRIGCGSERQK